MNFQLENTEGFLLTKAYISVRTELFSVAKRLGFEYRQKSFCPLLDQIHQFLKNSPHAREVLEPLFKRAVKLKYAAFQCWKGLLDRFGYGSGNIEVDRRLELALEQALDQATAVNPQYFKSWLVQALIRAKKPPKFKTGDGEEVSVVHVSLMSSLNEIEEEDSRGGISEERLVYEVEEDNRLIAQSAKEIFKAVRERMISDGRDDLVAVLDELLARYREGHEIGVHRKEFKSKLGDLQAYLAMEPAVLEMLS